MIFGHAKSQFLDEIPELIVRPQIDFWARQKSISGRNTKINCEATNWFWTCQKSISGRNTKINCEATHWVLDFFVQEFAWTSRQKA